jgi:hypothetical protein
MLVNYWHATDESGPSPLIGPQCPKFRTIWAVRGQMIRPSKKSRAAYSDNYWPENKDDGSCVFPSKGHKIIDIQFEATYRLKNSMPVDQIAEWL